MTAPRHPTAPATRRTRPDGWLYLQDRWHWTSAVGTLTAFSCGQPATVDTSDGHTIGASNLQDGPPDHGKLCKMCELQFGQFAERRSQTTA